GRSDSAGGFVGIDAGRTGTPGGDCTPGTPGNENISPTVGNFAAAPGYTAFPASAKSALAPGTANDGADLGVAGVDSGAFVPAAAEGDDGIASRAGREPGMLGCVACTCGTPGTEA